MTWTVPVPIDIAPELAYPCVCVLRDLHTQAEGKSVRVTYRGYRDEWGWSGHSRVERFLVGVMKLRIEGGFFVALDGRYTGKNGYDIGGPRTGHERATNGPRTGQKKPVVPTVSEAQRATNGPRTGHERAMNGPHSYKEENKSKSKINNLPACKRADAHTRKEGTGPPSPIESFVLECCQRMNPGYKLRNVRELFDLVEGDRDRFAQVWDALRVIGTKRDIESPLAFLAKALRTANDPEADATWITSTRASSNTGITANPIMAAWMDPIVANHVGDLYSRIRHEAIRPWICHPENWLWWFDIDPSPYRSALNGRRVEVLAEIAARGHPGVAEIADATESELRDLYEYTPDYLDTEEFRRDVAVRVTKRVGWVLSETERETLT